MTDHKRRRRQHRPGLFRRASALGGRTSIFHPFLHGEPDGHGIRSLSLLCLALALPSQQQMVQSVMNLAYSREEPVRANTTVSASEHCDTCNLVEFLVKSRLLRF